MERKDWVMLGGFGGTVLTVLVVFFTGLQTMNSRFEAVDSCFEAMEAHIEDRLQVIDRRMYEMNTRLSRIEGHLGITVAVPDSDTPSEGSKE